MPFDQLVQYDRACFPAERKTFLKGWIAQDDALALAYLCERDLVGYGGRPPHPCWPGNARVAVQFALTIEEGAEWSILNGEAESESYLHELPGRLPQSGDPRHAGQQ